MIDLIIVEGPLGTPQDHHGKRLAHVGVRRLSSHKVKPTATFVSSPLTGAQMEVRYWIENAGGKPLAVASVKIPLASATIGQNYAHAGLADIRLEMECAATLTKIALTVCGFSEDEVAYFMKHTRTDLLELTWHTQTNSRNAQRNLMKRTREAFEGLRSLSSRHDMSVRHVEFREKNKACSLLVTLKTGDEFRQYPKYDQIMARTNRGKSKYAVAPEIKSCVTRLHDVIETHGRNEIIFGPDTLAELGLSHPNAWSSESLRTAIDQFWRRAGLDSEARRFDPSLLGAAAAQTLALYDAGEFVAQSLSAGTFTRHRKEILAAGGPDIDPRAAGLADKLKSVGRQICYDKRWRIPGEFRHLVLCDATAPAIIVELKNGLGYIRDGVEPEFRDDGARDAWLARWKEYIQRERLWDPQFGIHRK
ncbi:hypothetical protein OKW45_006790 [Paraburkholderia sp. WSM4175]|uniref:hypothetical protein n=1 Tax=Paraburkholderia sp. WSM4175 TaxID=2991072 RepID=UPI003D23B050